MRMPKRPPDVISLLTADVLKEFLGKADVLKPTHNDQYIHWDKLVRLKPPDGWSHEKWWLGLKLARIGQMKAIPLLDATGQPFRFCLVDPIPELLLHIDQDAAGQIRTSEQVITSEARDHYIFRSLVEEAITSSQLEGAATTRRLAKQMIRTGRPPIDRSERMILNNYETMQHIRGITNKSLTPELVLELHRLVTDGTLDEPSYAGRLRQPHENFLVVDSYDEILHTPPPAEQLPDRLKMMCDFANAQTPTYFLHPVVRAVLLHFWLAYDHPFADGNGRCARALFYWSMLRQGYWLCEFLTISQIIKQGPARYVEAFLHTETDYNDTTYFILYHLEVLQRAIEALHRYIAKKKEQISQTEKLARVFDAGRRLNYRQIALLSHAMRHSDAQYTIKSHMTSHNVVHQTARTDLHYLVDKGLLMHRKRGRTIYYSPVTDLEDKLQNLR